MKTIAKQATIRNNSDFLFIYEASQCNPNGDPDQENKPRMDYETSRNIVTDTRIKRYGRDHMKNVLGLPVFVDLEGEANVSPASKMKIAVRKILENAELLAEVFADHPEYLQELNELLATESAEKVMNEKLVAKKSPYRHLSLHILSFLVKQQYIDIRMFGSAFAVEGFNQKYTGPIQLNWGYSLNKVELMESNSIVTIMADDNSTFGKDYRLYYSLLAFNGTINKFAAQSTGLTPKDLEVFRKVIWDSISSMPTRSKLNQYPKLYVEIVYNEGFHNGYFGDLRNLVACRPKEGMEERKVRKFDELTLDLSKLQQLIKEHKGEGKAIQEVIVKTSPDTIFSQD